MTPRDLFRLLLARAGISVTELARRSGARSRQSAISRWLNDPTHEIERRTLAPLAQVLKVPLDALLSDAGATRYAAEAALAPTPGEHAARQPRAAYAITATLEPVSLPAAIARVRSALLAVPEDQRVAVALAVIGQIGDSTVAPSVVAATLEAAARKRRRA